MSLGRVSYLEAWEHHPPPFIRQRSSSDLASGDGESPTGRRVPEDSLEASFLPSSLPSAFPSRSVRHKLSFNPYAGGGWTSSVTEPDEEHRPLFRTESGPGSNVGGSVPARVAEEGLAAEAVFSDPKWDTAETTPAFEVSSGKRICMLASLPEGFLEWNARQFGC